MPDFENIEAVKTYFEGLVAQTTKLKTFKYGSYRRVIEALKTEMEYPCLFLEIPEKGFSNGISDAYRNYDIAFAIIAEAEKDDYEKQDTLINNTLEHYAEQITRQVLVDMDMEERLDDVTFEAITGGLHDNVFGWRVVINAEFAGLICRDENFWDE